MNFNILWYIIFFFCPVHNNIYNIFDSKGVKFLTGLCLYLSHINGHRFGHKFQECMNQLCFCSLEIEDSLHYHLHCHHFNPQWIHLMSSVKTVCHHFKPNKKICFNMVTLILMKGKIYLF